MISSTKGESYDALLVWTSEKSLSAPFSNGRCGEILSVAFLFFVCLNIKSCYDKDGLCVYIYIYIIYTLQDNLLGAVW